MLATQTVDGDLRVWSVSKPPNTETPKILRILKRRDNVEPGLHWCAWSKNGRILQYSEGYVRLSLAIKILQRVAHYDVGNATDAAI